MAYLQEHQTLGWSPVLSNCMMAGSTEASPVFPRTKRSSKFSEEAKESAEMQPELR